MNWRLLGIEPTQDKKAITEAYRARLSQTNPEDKPEEFKALRAAYEEALQLADQPDTPAVRDESPVGLWLEEVRLLYDDFARRIRPENWEELLSSDVCLALDTRPLAEEALLKFLMQDFYIPQSVWQVLDRTFSWLERCEELYEAYPRDFVDYAVLNGIRYPGTLPYELFSPGTNAADCDEYRRLYYQIDRSPLEERDSLLEQLSGFSEKHPYGELLTYHRMLEKGEREEGLAGIRRLAEAYSQDGRLQLEWAAQCMNREEWTEGEEFARRTLALRPDSAQARQMLADCLAGQGEYEKAKKLVYQLMEAAGGDQKRLSQLHQSIQQWNEALIPILEEQKEAEPKNMELRIQLAWCYLQNDRDEDALKLCQTVDPDYEDSYDYHNVCARVAYSMEDYAAALPHLETMEILLRGMEEDGTEKTADRRRSLPGKLQMQGSCLLQLGRSEEAIRKYEEALELAPENPQVLTYMGRLLCSMGDHSRGAEIFEKLTKLLPASYHGFYLLAQTLFDLGRDRDAFEAVNRALSLESTDLYVYLLKIRILLRNGAWEGARETLDFLRQNGITDEIHTLWYEAQLLEQGEDKKEEALELYRSLAARVENNEFLEEASRLYFRLLWLEAEHLDAGKSEDRVKMLELANKGLSHDENDFSCLDYKAWLLKRDGKREEALEIYHRLESVPRHTMNVEKELAELYYEDLEQDADKALQYYQRLLEQDEQPIYLYYIGTCYRYLRQYEEAERCFYRLMEKEPEGLNSYYGLSYLYKCLNRCEEALEQIDKVIEGVQTWEGDYSSYYYHKARLLRRLNRPLEALEVLDELKLKYGNNDVFQDKFKICCQFALWEQAAQILRAWRRSGTDKKELKAAAIKLDLYTGKFKEVRRTLKREAGKLNEEEEEILRISIGELEGEDEELMAIYEKRARNREDKSLELMNMAEIQWRAGHYEQARVYACEALEQLDKQLSGNKTNEVMYRGWRSQILAILGRFEEAAEELERVRSLPLCQHCSYCACKDADVFEANIEEIRGNRKQALELYRAGQERWPDETDFVSGVRRIMRKGMEDDNRD